MKILNKYIDNQHVMTAIRDMCKYIKLSPRDTLWHISHPNIINLMEPEQRIAACQARASVTRIMRDNKMPSPIECADQQVIQLIHDCIKIDIHEECMELAHRRESDKQSRRRNRRLPPLRDEKRAVKIARNNREGGRVVRLSLSLNATQIAQLERMGAVNGNSGSQELSHVIETLADTMIMLDCDAPSIASFARWVIDAEFVDSFRPAKSFRPIKLKTSDAPKKSAIVEAEDRVAKRSVICSGMGCDVVRVVGVNNKICIDGFLCDRCKSVSI